MMKLIESLDREYDLIVVGGGGAALTAAAEASDLGLKVLLASKDPIACGDTKISEGGISVLGYGDKSDSMRCFSLNLRTKGDDLSDWEIVRTFVSESKHAYEWLRKEGMRSQIKSDGSEPYTYPMPLGGHNRARSVPHDNGGLSITHALLKTFQTRNYDYLENAWFLDILIDEINNEKYVVGGLIYLAAKGVILAIRAPAVLLATGGLGTLYFPNTDNMRGNTGDGYAVALRAGASLVDMEQIQFIPFALARPETSRGVFVGEPAAAGPLGVLRDKDGNVLLSGLMNRTRAEIASVMAKAIKEGRGSDNEGCFLDLSLNVQGIAGESFRKTYQKLNQRCLDIVRRTQGDQAARFKKAWEVQPSAHYCMGGVQTDENGKNVGLGAVLGLFAAGQTSGGLHGSDRLGSTSLSEILVFGLRAANAAADYICRSIEVPVNKFGDISKLAASRYLRMLGKNGAITPSKMIITLQKAAWDEIGPIRTAKGLTTFLNTINTIKRNCRRTTIPNNAVWNQMFIDQIELENLALAAEAIARSALSREASLGAHFRLDENKKEVRQNTSNSIAVHLEKTNWKMNKIPRVRTPFFYRLGDRIQTKRKQLQVELLKFLPDYVRGHILKSIFSKWS